MHNAAVVGNSAIPRLPYCRNQLETIEKFSTSSCLTNYLCPRSDLLGVLGQFLFAQYLVVSPALWLPDFKGEAGGIVHISCNFGAISTRSWMQIITYSTKKFRGSEQINITFHPWVIATDVAEMGDPPHAADGQCVPLHKPDELYLG